MSQNLRAIEKAIINQDEAEGRGPSAHVPRVPASAAQKKILNDAMADLITGYQFLASLACGDVVIYHAVDTDDFPVLATDNVAVYLNTRDNDKTRGFFSSVRSRDHRVFALGHETLHIVREDPLWKATHERMGEVPVPRTPACPDGRLPYVEEYYDKANDGVINAALVEDRVGKPLDGVFLHPALKPSTTRGEAYAIVYQSEEDKKRNQPPGSQQGGSQGQGQPNPDPLAGDQRKPGTMGDPNGDDSDESSRPREGAEQAQAERDAQAGQAERQVAVQRAVSAARQAGHGSTAAEAMVNASRAPGVDWRSYVQGFLARAAGNSAFDWKRPARPPMVRGEFGQEPYYSPARGGNGVNHVVFVGDTSGSIQEAEHRAMLAAMFEMMGELNPKQVSVVWCDSAIQRVDTFGAGCANAASSEDVEAFYKRKPIPRGGGTSFVPPFELMDAVSMGGTAGEGSENIADSEMLDLVSAGKPDGFIYFTDLHGRAPDAKPDYPVLWLVTTEKQAPWGERVGIDPQTLLK